MKIIKRNGEEQDFSPEKIRRVIRLANQSVQGTDRIKSDEDSEKIFHYVLESLTGFGTISVDTVQDKIRDAFMNFNYFEVADSFIKFRQAKDLQKKYTESEENIISVCNYSNESVKQDNANKNPRVLAVQRDYISGIKCKDIGKKLLPKDIVDGHNKGLIHFHDLDYSPVQKMSNCCLVNLKDMLENGFAMNGTPIHKTNHGFKTDCTLASQIAAQVAGQQYGGQTMSWAHIARSLTTSRMSIINELLDEGELEEYGIRSVSGNADFKDFYKYLSLKIKPEDLDKFANRVEKRLRKEIIGGVKTFQYQVLTILCSNGQTPFISMSMNLEDCEGDTQWEKDTKLVFEEVLRQRIRGIPDEFGNRVPVVFPKLLYFLDDRNSHPGTENWYLTKLAAECAAKTMAPDFISSKVQKKVKHTEHTWPCMGAARGDETVTVCVDNIVHPNIPIEQAYNLLLKTTENQDQFVYKDYNVDSIFEVCGVYKITHNPSGKYFIGSSKNIRQRIEEHLWHIESFGNINGKEASEDYDKNHYTYEILKECEVDELLDTELKYLSKHPKECINYKKYSKRLKAKKKDNVGDIFVGEGYTQHHKVDGHRCLVERMGVWTPIRAITYNDPKTCSLSLYRVTYEGPEGYKDLHITEDHPLRTRRGRIPAALLMKGDVIYDVKSLAPCSIVEVARVNESVPTYDFEVDNDMFDLSGILSYNCRSFATPYTPEPLYDDEKVGFNIGYKDTFTVRELFEFSKGDPKNFKHRMFLRKEGYYKGDVNEIDHFEEVDGRIKLVCRPKYWGFFNGGVVSINIPHIALESHGNKAEFWRLLDQRCELAYRALVKRYESLKDAPTDAAPILRQYGALMRLPDTETWNHMIVGPRSTYSLGYAGLWETQLYMTGKKLTEDQSFANEILNFFNKKHDEWHTRLVNKNEFVSSTITLSDSDEFELC